MNDDATVRIDPLVRAAYLAGRGQTADEIGAAINVRPQDVGVLLRLYEIPLATQAFGARLVSVRVARNHHAALETAAQARGVEPPEIARQILAVIGRGEISVDALLDDRPA